MYVHIESMQQMSEHDIRAAFPNTSFPLPFVAPEGYAFVYASPSPPHDPLTQAARETVPVLTEAERYEQSWVVVDLDATEREEAMRQIQSEIVEATQRRLDEFARTRNYDGILSAATYATSTVPKFATEGQYAVTARDATWATLYQILAEVEAGTRPVPAGFADVEPELPVLAWPE